MPGDLGNPETHQATMTSSAGEREYSALERHNFLHITNASEAKSWTSVYATRWRKETWIRFNNRLKDIGVYYCKKDRTYKDIKKQG